MTASQGAIETVTLFLPSTLSHEDLLLFDHQLDDCQHAGLRITHDWMIPHGKRDTDIPQACVVQINWENLDEMYHVESDQNSLFNNELVPLRKEAPEGSKTVLYTELQDAVTDRPSCVSI